jgi:DNA (cytosine-5)-methyltransferase 1
MSGHPAPSRETREDVAPTVTQGAPFSRTGNERVEAEALVTKDGAGQKWPADVASTLNAHYGSKHGLEDQHINGGAPLFVPSKIKNAKTFLENSEFLPTSYSIRDDVTPKTAKEITGTLSARDYKGVQAVTVIDRAAYNQGKNALYAPKIEQTELAPTVIAKGPHAVAFGAQNSACQGDSVSEHITLTLDKSKTPAVMTNMHVRRLTPTECERLQGFPDDYTQIPYRNKDAKNCPDGPRYKAMGNSMAVPVMRWIGERIQQVETLAVNPSAGLSAQQSNNQTTKGNKNV